MCCSCVLKIQTSCCSHGYCRSYGGDAHQDLTVISLTGDPAESMGDRLKKQAILDEKIKKFLAVRVICYHTGSLLFIIIAIEIVCNIECWNFYVCLYFFLSYYHYLLMHVEAFTGGKYWNQRQLLVGSANPRLLQWCWVYV
jgi:hypothetical protein